MSKEPISTPTKLCPTCGTRISAESARCLVCGADLSSSSKSTQAGKTIQTNRMPEVTLSLPVAILLLAVFLIVGAGLMYLAGRKTPDMIIPPTVTNTPTITVTVTPTPTEAPPTLTNTPEPSMTPVTYRVKIGDTCIGIAAFYQISVQSIVSLNNLPTTCDTLYENQPLLIPQPTPTNTPLPSATMGPAEQTEAACEKIEYVVQENDTLSAISITYNIPMAVLREYNGLPGDSVFLGQPIIIPLCLRFATPGPSPTPSPPPPYQAPNLLLPADGAPFTFANDSVTLQWASVGTLAENEAYAVTVMDVTIGEGQKIVDYVTDTKYIVPATIRPKESTPHVLRWWVEVVRQFGSDESGNITWTSAGLGSFPRVFTWSGGTAPAANPTP